MTHRNDGILKTDGMTRRDFLILGALAGAGTAWPAAGLGMTPPARLAFVGLGEHGKRYLEATLAMPQIDVAGLVDRCSSTLRAGVRSCRHAGRPTPATPRFESLLGDPAIEGLVIAVPGEAQGELARRACAAGKHVLLGTARPLGPRVARQLSDAAARRGCLLEQASTTTFSLDHRLARALRQCELRRCRIFQRVDGDVAGTTCAPHERLGGALSELDFARGLLEVGLPNRVTALRAAGPTRWQSDSLRIALRFPSRSGPEKGLELDIACHPRDRATTPGPVTAAHLLFEGDGFSLGMACVTPTWDVAAAEKVISRFARSLCLNSPGPFFGSGPDPVSCSLGWLAARALERDHGLTLDPETLENSER